ncbi:hypothetical protein ACO3VM_00115 [Methanocaldococcus sp. 10A]
MDKFPTIKTFILYNKFFKNLRRYIMIEKVYEFKKDAITKVVEKIVNTEHVQL